MFVSYAFGVVVLFFVLVRQTRVRPVRRAFQPRLPFLLTFIGLFELIDYTGTHHTTSVDWLWLGGTLLAAVVLGALRGLSVRIWASNHWVVRQGTAATMVLWVVSLVVHFLAGAGGVHAGGGHAGAADLQGASLLAFLGLTLGVQGFVIHRRAIPLWGELGPDAGRRIQVNFGQGPNAFFTTFFTNFSDAAPGTHPGAHDPDIIDAEVVEDDDGPPELPRPR
jgi:hypothetical protein